MNQAAGPPEQSEPKPWWEAQYLFNAMSLYVVIERTFGAYQEPALRMRSYV
jgi:hypothetical protein